MLARSEIRTAAWGALLGGASDHWGRLCKLAGKANGDAHCCRQGPRPNLKSSGLLIHGQDVPVVDYLHYDLATHVRRGEGLWGERAGRLGQA